METAVTTFLSAAHIEAFQKLVGEKLVFVV